MAIPNIFFIDRKMYKRIKIIKSDESVVAFDFEEESRVWLPQRAVEKSHRRGFTIGQTATMINVKSHVVKDAIKTKRVPPPYLSYNPTNYRPERYYIHEDDLMEYRDAIWEWQPKNRLGEPYRDRIASKSELETKLFRGDANNFITQDGDLIQIFSV